MMALLRPLRETIRGVWSRFTGSKLWVSTVVKGAEVDIGRLQRQLWHNQPVRRFACRQFPDRNNRLPFQIEAGLNEASLKALKAMLAEQLAAAQHRIGEFGLGGQSGWSFTPSIRLSTLIMILFVKSVARLC